MGAWIEILTITCNARPRRCRTPRWVRGLKSSDLEGLNKYVVSHPTMGAWIEIILIEQLMGE